MALRYVILSLVAAKPQSGYDIVKSFDHSIGHIWQASHQQVYRELGKLAKDSWLEFEREAQTDKPDRKVYNITAEGRQHLNKWLVSSVETPAYRSPILVRLLALPVVGPEPLIPAVRKARSEYESKLKAYQALDTYYTSHQDPAEVDLSLRLALRMAILFTEPMLGWCDEAVEALQQQQLTNTSNVSATAASTSSDVLETN